MTPIKTLAAFLLLFITLLPTGLTESPDEHDPTKAAVDLLSKVNKDLKLRHISEFEIPNKPTVSLTHDVLRQREIIWVRFSPQINVQFAPKPFEVIAFYKSLAPEQLNASAAPIKPAWTPEKAIKEAQAWYCVIIGKFPANTGTPTVEYVTPTSNPPKYYDGEWMIKWPRTDAMGNRFALDNITATVSEKYGITSLAKNFVSEFSENTKIAIPEKDAIEIARPVAQKLLKSPLISQWATAAFIEDGASAKMWIINPNHILNYENIGDIATAGDLKARLAWVVKFRISNSDAQNRDIFIWIDAENADLLGGDFQ